MRYGNFKQEIIDLSQEKAALQDLLEKGEINQAQYNAKLSKLQVARNMQLAITNGGYSPKTKGKKRKKLEELRSESVRTQTLDMRDRILEETKKALEAAEEPPTT